MSNKSVRPIFCATLLAACGDNFVADPALAIVGHTSLGDRGMNSALAVAGDYVYVGSRIDFHGIDIVDVHDRANPKVVGNIPGVQAISPRELRAIPDRDLLIVLELHCSVMLHGCTDPSSTNEGLVIYDIADRTSPHELARYTITGLSFREPRSPHEMFVWHDLVFVTAPLGPPSLEVVDLSDPAAPKMLAQWDPVKDGGLVRGGGDDILHSFGVSPDGKTGYASHQLAGLVVVDLSALPAISMITPPERALDWAPPSPSGPHSAVKVPNRDVLVVTDEVYPMPYGAGCPWGHLRLVDISDPTTPTVASEVSLDENHAPCNTLPKNAAYTAHNVTATEHLAFATWYAGGLQLIDTTDAAHPARIAEFRPTPIEAVDKEDPVLGGVPVEMWSYPIISNGDIFVVDVRNGLYILRYAGPYERELDVPLLEGNAERD